MDKAIDIKLSSFLVRRRIFLAGVILIVCALTGCSRGAIPAPRIELSAVSAVIIEADSARVLFAKNPEKKFPPASTAKVMTAILAMEYLPPNKEIEISNSAFRSTPTVAGLKRGVKYRAIDLVKAILIKSANDAARAIAEAVSGDEKNFAALMNEKAARIGMKNTFFANASGLPAARPDTQYTTVEDLVTLMRYAISDKTLLDIMSQSEADIYGSDDKKIRLVTHNKSLIRDMAKVWGKTGYTREARYAFVGIDPSFNPRIVFALLKSNNLWGDVAALEKNGLEIYQKKHRTIISYLADWIKSGRKKASRVIINNQ